MVPIRQHLSKEGGADTYEARRSLAIMVQKRGLTPAQAKALSPRCCRCVSATTLLPVVIGEVGEVGDPHLCLYTYPLSK